jgi:hypothetical protein
MTKSWPCLPSSFEHLKSDPAAPGVKTLQQEIVKRQSLRVLRMPAEALADVDLPVNCEDDAQPRRWGEGHACASDGKCFESWRRNFSSMCYEESRYMTLSSICLLLAIILGF